jgi:hypothetical protein
MVAEQALGNGPLGVFSIVNGDRHPLKGSIQAARSQANRSKHLPCQLLRPPRSSRTMERLTAPVERFVGASRDRSCPG